MYRVQSFRVLVVMVLGPLVVPLAERVLVGSVSPLLITIALYSRSNEKIHVTQILQVLHYLYYLDYLHYSMIMACVVNVKRLD